MIILFPLTNEDPSAGCEEAPAAPATDGSSGGGAASADGSGSARHVSRSNRNAGPAGDAVIQSHGGLHGGDVSGVGATLPTGTVGDPDDFGAAVAFLCSQQARFVTGTTLLVDGGAYPGTY